MIPVVIRVSTRATSATAQAEAVPVYLGTMPGIPSPGDFVRVDGLRLFVIGVEWMSEPDGGAWHVMILTEDLSRPVVPSPIFAASKP